MEMPSVTSRAASILARVFGSPWGWEDVVNQAAIPVSLLVKVSNVRCVEVREVCDGVP